MVRNGQIHRLNETARHGEFTTRIVEGMLGDLCPSIRQRSLLRPGPASFGVPHVEEEIPDLRLLRQLELRTRARSRPR